MQTLSQENNQEENNNLQNGEWFLAFQNKWFLSKESKAVLPGHDSWFQNPLQATKIVHKANKRKKVDMSEVSFQLTKDPELLQQYYDLRERNYRAKLGFENYNGQETDYDKTGDIFLEVLNGKTVFGARVDFSNKNKLMYNDNPDNGFYYKDVIKKFDQSFQDHDIYSEICGLVFDGKIENHAFIKFFNNLVEHSISQKARYVVGIAYPSFYKMYKIMFTRIGYDFVIFDNIKLNVDGYGPNKFGLEFCPIVIKNY